MKSMFDLGSDTALLLTSWLCSFGFWALLLRLMRRWLVALEVGCAVVLAILAHPASMYLIAGYSESLFLLSTLLFFMLQDSNSRPVRVLLAGAAGFVMTATRLVGLPIVVLPLLRMGLCPNRSASVSIWSRTVAEGVVTMLMASAGAAAFFGYCWYFLGDLDIYFFRQRWSWSINPDYLILAKPRIYTSLVKHLSDADYSWAVPTLLNSLTVIWYTVVLLVLGISEVLIFLRKRNLGWQARVLLYYVVGVCFYLSIAGVGDKPDLLSMVRYGLVPYVFVLLAVAHLSSVYSLRSLVRIGVLFLLLGHVLVMLRLQPVVMHRFFAGLFVG